MIGPSLCRFTGILKIVAGAPLIFFDFRDLKPPHTVVNQDGSGGVKKLHWSWPESTLENERSNWVVWCARADEMGKDVCLSSSYWSIFFLPLIIFTSRSKANHFLGPLQHHSTILSILGLPFPHATSQWVIHHGSAKATLSLNFGVPTEPEASEHPKGLVLGRDENIHLRITPLDDGPDILVGPLPTRDWL
ncbi:hypothetical protein DVH24_032438 [Malus domestica]|uniref:Uncharacterized protein n=1 Tax=Malus domestica TaxID=3750 RepID=A0A498J9K7_MALDO|nr:hypothetical protein DVH24_032438 [Malus domestica]